ncbi:arylsulfatase [Pricia antarctica]|uniref:Arylsulfatase n=1 Tax=Pricia antarctica TaxID=641691 RepID=A0A1G7F8H3_9FLAO|nr:arylsulfatase [Pricia antarctica]SDE72243.1 arylsulfatase [Pricia antarctica]
MIHFKFILVNHGIKIGCFLIFILTFQFNYSQSRPNIVMIMTDDLGYGDLGIHGNPYVKSPNIDALGRESVEFTRFYSYPSCSTTRAAVMTGRWPYRTGMLSVFYYAGLMQAKEVTIAETLGDSGYRTGIFGKWHLGDSYPMRPTDNGFQEALVHKGGGIGQPAGPPGNTYYDPILEHNNVSKRYEGYCDDIFFDSGMQFIRQSHEDKKPFLAYISTPLVHLPLTINDDKVDPYRKMGLHENNARLYAMVSNVDANVGRVMGLLKELGIEDSTIVIFMSDNGPRDRRTKNDNIPGRYNYNLRGTKTSVYESGIRVPFFIKYPSKFAGAIKIDNAACVIDVLPTLLEACKVSPADGVEIDGLSLLPLIEQKVADLPERLLYFQLHQSDVPFEYMHFAVRGPRYKLVAPQDNPHGIIFQPRDGELKSVLESLELYDVQKDSSEMYNIAGKHPEIVYDYLSSYENWWREVTQDRAKYGVNGVQPIYIGDPAEKVTVLSRFDWGGPGILSGRRWGQWIVHSEQGKYKITLRFDPVEEAGKAVVQFGKAIKEKGVNIGDTELVFYDVDLEENTGIFDAFIKHDDYRLLKTGMRFVDIERTD